MCPFPVVPAFGIDYPAIIELKQKFTGIVSNVDQVINKLINALRKPGEGLNP